MSDLDAELSVIFRDDAIERLNQMDKALLTVESEDAGAEEIGALFRHAHTIKGAAGMLGLDDIRALGHAVEGILASVRDTQVFPPELAALLLRATAALRARVTGADEPVNDLLDDLAASEATLRDRDVRAPGVSSPEGGQAEGGQAEGGQAEGGQPEARAPDADARQPVVPEARRPAAARRALRVPAEKIDHLLDVSGEVMQYRRRLAHLLGDEARLSPDLVDMLASGDRMLDDLKNTAVAMRTLPVAVIAGPLPRAVRDFARAAGKDVEFIVTGADTELDRVILESLSEPLAHLLRNAVNHGIESAAERERAQKPPRGRIELRAEPCGSLVQIVVSDDGQGVSPEVIDEANRTGSLATVLARAGYSTAGEVTDLAGRGVGLDAVKMYAQSLGGSLEVRSIPGRGMDVILVLPLALALLDVLLFERGGSVYGVPLAAVEEVVMVTETLALEGRAILEIRRRPLPVTDFAALVGAAAPPQGDRSPALVISAGGQRAVVTCDVLLGEEEVVVKPLSPLVAGVDGRYLGTALLGDGRIALLVEPAALTRRPGRSHVTAVPAATDPPVAPKLLVVEDSFTVRELQRSILQAAGYHVMTASDGRDALRALDGDSEIALVITDVEMPGLGGIELTQAIRAGASRSSLPVVIVSSRGSQDDRRRGLDAGADAYIAKQSFDQGALLATVDRLVGR